MKWLKPNEVTETGNYLLHRTDDVSFTTLVGRNEGVPTVHVHQGIVYHNRYDAPQNIATLDPECLLFGPIPGSYDR